MRRGKNVESHFKKNPPLPVVDVIKLLFGGNLHFPKITKLKKFVMTPATAQKC